MQVSDSSIGISSLEGMNCPRMHPRTDQTIAATFVDVFNVLWFCMEDVAAGTLTLHLAGVIWKMTGSSNQRAKHT